MKAVPSLIRLGAALGAALLAACASTDYHYSELIGRRYFRAPIDTFDVSIVSVDGKDQIIRPVRVDPGLRQITVQGPPGALPGPGREVTVPLNIAACTRYWLVAVKPNRLEQDFSVKVDFQEPVSGCTPPRSS